MVFCFKTKEIRTELSLTREMQKFRNSLSENILVSLSCALLTTRSLVQYLQLKCLLSVPVPQYSWRGCNETNFSNNVTKSILCNVLCSPLVFRIDEPKFQNALVHALVSHGPKSSATKNKICLVILVKISNYHFCSLPIEESLVLASYLQNHIYSHIPPTRIALKKGEKIQKPNIKLINLRKVCEPK